MPSSLILLIASRSNFSNGPCARTATPDAPEIMEIKTIHCHSDDRLDFHNLADRDARCPRDYGNQDGHQNGSVSFEHVFLRERTILFERIGLEFAVEFHVPDRNRRGYRFMVSSPNSTLCLEDWMLLRPVPAVKLAALRSLWFFGSFARTRVHTSGVLL